ncbi:DUF11 domain-containing protein [Chloroflexus sp.]|uniref:DUF11 domain-containing protein n=1 Tax=Chloroflexus sp. TaxID=1904827 RepID=UPI002ACE688E|nr:DUF11 domain-containing protein [Chloroflexus sp.]
MRHIVWRFLPIVLGGVLLLMALLSTSPVLVDAAPQLNITETSTAEPPTRTPTNTPVAPPTNTPVVPPTNTPVVPPTNTPELPVETPTPAVPPGSPGAAPDLVLSKSVSPSVAQIGDQVVYTLTIGNTGSAPATDITLTDNLPPSLRLIGVTTTIGNAGTNGNQVTVTAPSLAPGETIVVQVTAQVVAPLVAPNNINTASVRTSSVEITTDNNTSSATLGSPPVVPPSSLPQTAGNPARPFLTLIGLALIVIGLGALLHRRAYR